MYNFPLKQVIRNQISVEDYFDIMYQILLSIEDSRREDVQVVLEASKMSVKDGKLQFDVERLDGVYELTEIKNFIKGITFDCIFEKNEDCTTVTKFLQMTDSVSEVNFFQVMIRYCETQLGIMDAQQGVQENRAAAANYSGRLVQAGNEGETGVLDNDFWKRLENSNQPKISSANGETGVLDPDFWRKLSQNQPGGAAHGSPTGRLVHARTGNVAVINKENFWIGKGDVDLKIDKDIVSRKHAQIIVRQNHYFIFDNDSTNKTYVDGKEIPPKASVELYDGTHVKFANEEYVFQI